MVKRIDSLTVEKWVKVGLRTGVLSREEWAEVDAAARAAYRFSGLAEPVIIQGVSSPLAGAIAAAVASEVAPAACETPESTPE
jgi:hypothetical protein